MYPVSSPLNILNGCLFIVKHLNSFIDTINKNDKIVVNKGPQKWRGQVNSINKFLSCLDMDFRNSLYNHNRYHIENNLIDRSYELKKTKFSFRDIHMNIGNVRWCSTINRPLEIRQLSTSENKNGSRQNLSYNNYHLISNILFKNNNIGSTKVQHEIETLLRYK